MTARQEVVPGLRSLAHEATGAVNAGVNKGKGVIRRHPFRTAGVLAGATVGAAIASVGVAALRDDRYAPPPAAASELAQSGVGDNPPVVLPSQQAFNENVVDNRTGGTLPPVGEPPVFPPQKPTGDQPSAEPSEGGEGGEGEPSQPAVDNSAVAGEVDQLTAEAPAAPAPQAEGATVPPVVIFQQPVVEEAPAPASAGQGEQNPPVIASREKVASPSDFSPKFHPVGPVSPELQHSVFERVKQYLSRMMDLHPAMAQAAREIMEANSLTSNDPLENRVYFHILSKSRWAGAPPPESTKRAGPAAFDVGTIKLPINRNDSIAPGYDGLIFQLFWREHALEMSYNNQDGFSGPMAIYAEWNTYKVFREYVLANNLSPQEAVDLFKRRPPEDKLVRIGAEDLDRTLNIWRELRLKIIPQFGNTTEVRVWNERLRAREAAGNNWEAWVNYVRGTFSR